MVSALISPATFADNGYDSDSSGGSESSSVVSRLSDSSSDDSSDDNVEYAARADTPSQEEDTICSCIENSCCGRALARVEEFLKPAAPALMVFGFAWVSMPHIYNLFLD